MTCCAGLRLFATSAPCGALLHPADEVADDADVDVGLEQRDAELATDLVDVLVGELPAAAERVEDAVEAVGERVEHGRRLAIEDFDRTSSEGGRRTPRARTRSGRRHDSPTPISFTGIPSSASMASTMPPLAVPSSLVSTTPVTSTASANWRAWVSPFWPVVASRTSSTSLSAPGVRSTMRRSFSSSAMRLILVWRRPAVSTSTRSASRLARRAHGVEDDRPGVGALLAPHDARRR